MVSLGWPGTCGALGLALALIACTVPGNDPPVVESSETDGAIAASVDKVETSSIAPAMAVAPSAVAVPAARIAWPAWTKRVELASRPDISVSTIQPLYHETDSTEMLFTQVRVNRSAPVAVEPRTTSSFGLGYRRLLFDGNMLAGINGFYDRNWEREFHRAGADAELKWKTLDFTVNTYHGLDGLRDSGNGADISVLDGYNFKLTGPLPYLPWARAGFASTEFFEDDGETAFRRYTTSMEFDLHRTLRLEAGVRGSDSSDEVGFVSLRFKLNRNTWRGVKKRYALSDAPLAPVAFEARELQQYMLDKVRRLERIVTSS